MASMTSTASQEQYQIQRDHGRKHLAPSPSPYLFKVSNTCCWSLWILYVCFQASFVFLNFEIASHWRIYASVLAEILITLPEVLFLLGTTFTIWKLPRTSEARKGYRLDGEAAPTVDVFVTCAGEPTNTVINTVMAAIAQDYPAAKFRVLLLDDGSSPDLRQAATKLREGVGMKPGPAVHYLARAPDDHDFGKAGNLQYGLEWTKDHGSSEFFASLDADMIVDPDWLRRMVPHVLLDDAIGLVNPPQTYYNTPAGDPLGSEADLVAQYGVYEPLNDRLGASICTGTGFVARRKAVEDIGGWPLIVPCDDITASTKLNQHGWEVAYVQESVQVGLGPGSWEAAINQKMRWKAGMLIYTFNSNFFSPDTDLSRMSWFQRAAGIIQSLGSYIPVLFVVSALFLPLASWPTLGPSRNKIPTQPLKWLFLAAYAGQKINLYVVYRQCGLRTARTLKYTSIWISPYESFVCLKSLFTINGRKHQSLGSVKSQLNERSESRASLFHRIVSLPMALYVLYAVLGSTPFLLELWQHERSVFLVLPGPLIKLLECVTAALIPIRYMVFPPTIPNDEALLETDDDGVQRPRRRETKPDNGVSYVDALECLVISWCFGWI